MASMELSRRHFVALASAAGLALGAGALTQALPRAHAAEQAAGKAADGMRTYTDMTGVEMQIPVNPTKVVSLWQVTTILTAFLGGNGCCSAVLDAVKDGKSMGWLAEMCPELLELPSVKSSATVEELLLLEPELVIVNEPMADQAETYRAAGLTVAVLSNATNFENLHALVPKVAEIYGEKAVETAEELMAYLDDTIADAQERTKDLPEEDVLSVYSNWAQKGTSPLLTSGNGSLISTWLTYVGCRNIITDQMVKGDSGNETNIETIIEMDPDYILVGGVNWEKALETIETDPSWAGLTAVQEGRILVNPLGVTKWSAIGVEFPLQIMWFGQQTHPELFGDIDLREEVRAFYLKYLGYEISDENLDALLAGSLGPVEKA